MTKSNSDPVAAHELALFGINTRDLYFDQAKLIIANLAKHKQRGVYDDAKALKAWGYWAESCAKAYMKEFRVDGDWFVMFSKATREEAAKEAMRHYEEHIRDLAEDLQSEANNKRDWPMSAIRSANENAGRYFFSRETMRFFGDTMACWGVDYCGTGIFIVRCKQGSKRMGKLGERRRFDPETGEISSPMTLD